MFLFTYFFSCFDCEFPENTTRKENEGNEILYPIVPDNFKKYSMKTNPKTNILLIEYFKQKRRQFLLKL